MNPTADFSHLLPHAGKPPQPDNALVRLEDGLDRSWYRLKCVVGQGAAKQIRAFTGYGNAQAAWIGGRVLSDQLRLPRNAVNHWWANLMSTWQRCVTAEVPNVPVQCTWGSQTIQTVTDREGYFNVVFQPATPPASGWHDVQIKCGTVSGTGHILIPSPTARFGVISDMDDTVIHTHLADPLVALGLTVLANARTRRPLEAVAQLYHAFENGGAETTNAQRNPIFYVSSSSWNLHNLLQAFLDINNIPAGPLILRDIGLARRLTRARSHWQKLENTSRILAAYPNLPFILIGDSGQQDARIYHEAVRTHPGRIAAVYIRNIEPHRVHKRDERVLAIARQVEALGVPMRLVSDSREIAEHAISLGLINSW